jgi:hypothetical protein
MIGAYRKCAAVSSQNSACLAPGHPAAQAPDRFGSFQCLVRHANATDNRARGSRPFSQLSDALLPCNPPCLAILAAVTGPP